jgi:hypothetical protein
MGHGTKPGARPQTSLFRTSNGLFSAPRSPTDQKYLAAQAKLIHAAKEQNQNLVCTLK